MKSALPEPLFLSVPDAARLCGVSRNTLYSWVRKGKLSAYQTPGRTNLIRPMDLVTFMKESGLFVPPALIEMAKKDEAAHQPATEEQANDTRPGVLITDDDVPMRSLLVRMLELNFKVFQAGTGYEALHMLTLHPDIKLVLLDLRMPGQHGLSTLNEVSALRPDLKVIIVTGYAGEVQDLVMQNERVSAVLHKPVEKAVLQDAVKQALSPVE